MKKLTSGSQIDGVNYLLTFSLGNFILFTEFCNWNSADSINKVIIKTKKHGENGGFEVPVNLENKSIIE